MSGQEREQADPGDGIGFPASPGAARRTGSGVAGGLLLGVMTIAAYLPAMRCGFIWDDDRYVQNNELLHSLDGLPRIWKIRKKSQKNKCFAVSLESRPCLHRVLRKIESENHDRFSTSAVCHELLHPITLRIDPGMVVGQEVECHR